MSTSTPRIQVLLLFGGRSSEHEISLLSARTVAAALDRARFAPVLVAIDKQGRWRRASPAELDAAVGDPRHLRLGATAEEVFLPARPASAGPLPARLHGVWPDLDLDPAHTVVFPVLHGKHGEDGTVQGLVELAGLPCVGAGVLGSAAAMDKDVAKRLVAHAGVPVVPWHLVRAAAHRADPGAAERAAAALGYPVFVKPANAGSSVGVSRVRSADALSAAIAEALRHDDKVLIEAGLDAREIECAVLGNDEPIVAVPGEVVVTHPDGFYSYDAKYVDPSGATVRIPAELPAEVSARVRELAARAFTALELAGMARIDFFLDRRDGALHFNEANTIPGFTAISMYPKMWEASGVPLTELLSRLIDLARTRHAHR